ncbi:hypothetical protein E2562_019638 [Oryza meyeriana var. granulata]|uniref:Uncharacterized protein n=1 Tax=Oryza meyeriana var. granulata TaxID=110450 RepID=A0A6G1C7L4_9ORYZ|nr:hypothetical protein E2562_019638 [Oryza meyeriana var. granulata]
MKPAALPRNLPSTTASSLEDPPGAIWDSQAGWRSLATNDRLEDAVCCRLATDTPVARPKILVERWLVDYYGDTG